MSRDNSPQAPKAALSLQTVLPCNERAGLSLVFTDTNLSCSVSDNRRQDRSQIPFTDRAALALVCSHIYAVQKHTTSNENCAHLKL